MISNTHLKNYISSLLFSGLIITSSLSVFGQVDPQIQAKPQKQKKFYGTSSGEYIFSFADVTDTAGNSIPTNMRFTCWFHIGRYLHYNINNTFGLMSGIGMRNIGFITEDDSIKIKRRSYTLGIPLAFKIGSFKDNFYLFAGGEYEWLFHYKQKFFVDDTKEGTQQEWFSSRTTTFLPSVFAGIQFPFGLNVKFRYYLDDFMNNDYKGKDFGRPADYSYFKTTQIYYFSLSYQIPPKFYKQVKEKAKGQQVYAYK
jgi:hypothetical protein